MVARGFSFDPTAQWPWEPPGLGQRGKSVNLFLNHPRFSEEKASGLGGFNFWNYLIV
jgi:hypothetical protein